LATLNSRTTLWSEAFGYLRKRPIFGYGLTASRSLFLDTLGLGGAHNGFVNVSTDAGIVGAAWWLGLLAILGITLRRLARQCRFVLDVALLAGTLAFLVVDSLTTEGLGTPANSAVTWLFVVTAWVVVLQRPSVTA
jgi:O-antigen ligase